MIFIAGPCVIEDESSTLEIAEFLKNELKDLPLDFYFKASFDKANRSSINSFRGPGLEEGLRILNKVKTSLNVKVLTDFHTPDQAKAVCEVVDGIQIPAFLSRQTDMIAEAVKHAVPRGIMVNIKKAQFTAPWDIEFVIQKAREVDPNVKLHITERGSSFGYQRLVVDMISFPVIQSFGVDAIYDATHSLQLPGGSVAGGQRQFMEPLAKAAIAAGAKGIFMECHPNPPAAKSDPSTVANLKDVKPLVEKLIKIKASC